MQVLGSSPQGEEVFPFHLFQAKLPVRVYVFASGLRWVRIKTISFCNTSAVGEKGVNGDSSQPGIPQLALEMQRETFSFCTVSVGTVG